MAASERSRCGSFSARGSERASAAVEIVAVCSFEFDWRAMVLTQEANLAGSRVYPPSHSLPFLYGRSSSMSMPGNGIGGGAHAPASCGVPNSALSCGVRSVSSQIL